jgi:dimethylhistidine N-methyltransferase
MEKITTLSEIVSDTLQGLSAKPKYLLPKYFYDDQGSRIFQEIMQMPEYYLTDCEYEIFASYKKQIASAFYEGNVPFNLIELGAGDGTKTKILLRQLVEHRVPFSYSPVDISQIANDELVKSLKTEMPSLTVNPKTGDFFRLMRHMNGHPAIRKIILFLGSNIGNFSDGELTFFLKQLASFTHPGDKVFIGFDLKKSPDIIMKAYNDPHGHTRNFNLNHLMRLNRELGANFNIGDFEQHTQYDPVSGAVKSFLVSKTKQTVFIEALEKTFYFKKWEPVFMELSRKFDSETIGDLASSHGFKVEQQFTDSQNYFVDSLWVKG